MISNSSGRSRRRGSNGLGHAPADGSKKRARAETEQARERLPTSSVYFSRSFSFLFLHQIEEPAEGIIEHRRFERIGNELAVLLRGDEFGLPQEVEVIGDAGRAHGESGADFADGEVACLEHFQDAPAGRIAEGLKEEVQYIDI